MDPFRFVVFFHLFVASITETTKLSNAGLLLLFADWER